MRLYFKQRFFSWLDSYDVYDEAGETVYTVEGQLSWGHKLHILDREGVHVGTVREEVLTLLPRFALYVGEDYVGAIARRFSLFRPQYEFDCNGWEAEGDLMGWEYDILDGFGTVVANIRKELFHWTDTYVINVAREEDALCALMFTLAVDAEHCDK